MGDIRVQDEQGNIHVFPDGSTPDMIAKAMNVKPPDTMPNAGLAGVAQPKVDMQPLGNEDMTGNGMPSQEDVNPTAEQHPITASALNRAGQIVKGTMALAKPPQTTAEKASLLAGPAGPIVTRLIEGQVEAEKQAAPQVKAQFQAAQNVPPGYPAIKALSYARAGTTALSTLDPFATGSVANVNKLNDEGKPDQAAGEGITDALALASGLKGPKQVISDTLSSSAKAAKGGITSTADALNNTRSAIAEKAVAPLVRKPVGATLQDNRFGRNPAKAIADEGLVGTKASLPGKIQDRVGQLSDAIDSTLQNHPNANATIDARPIIDSAIDNAVSAAEKTGNQAGVTRLENLRQALHTKYGPTQGTPFEINNFKRDVGQVASDLGAFKSTDPIEASAAGAMQDVYTGLKNAVNAHAPEVAPLNERIANLLSAQTGLKRNAALAENGSILDSHTAFSAGAKLAKKTIASAPVRTGVARALNAGNTLDVPQVQPSVPAQPSFIRGLLKQAPTITPPPADTSGSVPFSEPPVAATSRAQRMGLLLPEKATPAPIPLQTSTAPTSQEGLLSAARRTVRDPKTGQMKVQYLTSPAESTPPRPSFLRSQQPVEATPAQTPAPRPSFLNRRQPHNAAIRQKVADMSPEDRATALLTSEKTGLPNYRAFQEAPDNTASHVGYADLDNFKSYNDALSHKGVDTAVLPAVGDMFKEAADKHGVQVFHRSGDEFLFRSSDPQAIHNAVDDVNQQLANTVFEYQTPDGRILTKKGTGLSHGIGQDEHTAELSAQEDKQIRASQGLRSERETVPGLDPRSTRGEPSSASDNTGRQGIPGRASDADQENPVTPPEQIDLNAPKSKRKIPPDVTAKADYSGNTVPAKAPTFFSKAEQVAEEKLPNQMPANSVMPTLRNAGVKADELKWLGLDDYLAGKKTVSKTDLLDHIRQNNVQVKEVVKGGDVSNNRQSVSDLQREIDALRPKVDAAWERAFADDKPGEKWSQLERVNARHWAVQEADGIPNGAQKLDALNISPERRAAITEYGKLFAHQTDLVEQSVSAEKQGSAKFSQYQLPGGENYRELLMTLPSEPETFSAKLAKRRLTEDQFDALSSGERTRIQDDIRRERDSGQQNFLSSHFDEPNVLAHVRFNDRITYDSPKPNRAGPAQNNFIGSEAASVLPLDVVESGVARLMHNNEVRGAVIRALPVDVMNLLNRLKLSPEELLSNKPVSGKLASASFQDRLRIASGLADALGRTEASLRAKVSSSLVAGLDKEILPTLRTSQLDPGEVRSLLSPPKISKSDTGGVHSGGAVAGAESTGSRGASGEANSTVLAKFIQARDSQAGLGAKGGSGNTGGIGNELSAARLTDLLDRHSKILADNDRISPDGKKTLFLEELQSDWHQKGRKGGYKGADGLPEGSRTVPISEYEGRKIAGEPKFVVLDKNGDPLGYGQTEDAAKQLAARNTNTGTVPDAPFKTTWHELAMKRMLRYAAENGYDQLAWTTGEQQAARYDLSKYVSSIRYKPNSGGGFTISAKPLQGGETMLAETTPQNLADTVGKEAAAKITKGEGDDIGSGYRELKGEELKVGGQGMKGFYDKILPDFLNKYGKKWGAKVGESVIKTPPMTRGTGGTYDTPVHSIPITPAMRNEVIFKGQPISKNQPVLPFLRRMSGAGESA